MYEETSGQNNMAEARIDEKLGKLRAEVVCLDSTSGSQIPGR